MDAPSTPPRASRGQSSPPSVRQQHRAAVRQGQVQAAQIRQARASQRNLLSQFNDIAVEEESAEPQPRDHDSGAAVDASEGVEGETLRNLDEQPPLMPPPRPQRRASVNREHSTPPPSSHALSDDFSPFHGSVASLGSPLMESDHSVTAAGASSNRDDLLLSDSSGGMPGCSNASILLSASALPIVPERQQHHNTPPRSALRASAGADQSAGSPSPSQGHTPERSQDESPHLRSATAQALWRSRRRAVAGAGVRGTSRAARLRLMQQAAGLSPVRPSSGTSAKEDNTAGTDWPGHGGDAASVVSAGSARSLVSLQSLLVSVATGAPPPGVTANRSVHRSGESIATSKHTVTFSGVSSDSSTTPKAVRAAELLHAPSPIRKRGAGASRLSTEDAELLRSSTAPVAAPSPPSLPAASPLRAGSSAVARARARLAAPQPGSHTAHSSSRTPTTGPAVRGVGSHLPLRFERLCAVAAAVDSVAKAMTNRGPGLLTFDKLKPSVQSVTQRLLTPEMLRHVVGVVPGMYALSQKAMDSHGRPLSGAASRKKQNWHTVVLLQAASSVEFPKRRAKFRAACRAFVAEQHRLFLVALGYSLPAVAVNGQPVLQPDNLPRLALPVLRNSEWHPDFDLEMVEPPMAPLPPPSAATPVQPRELLRGTAAEAEAGHRGQATATSRNMTPTVARALAHAASTQGRPQAHLRTPPRAGGAKRSAALALLASQPPPPEPPSHVTLSDSSGSASGSAVHDAASLSSAAAAGDDQQQKCQRKSSVQFSPVRTPQRDDGPTKPASRLYDAPTGGSVSTAPLMRSAVAVGASPGMSTVASRSGLLTPGAAAGQSFGTTQQAIHQGASHRTLHFPSSASASSGESADAAGSTVVTARDKARAMLAKTAPTAGHTHYGASSATTATVESAVATGSTAGEAPPGELPADLAFLRSLGAGDILARTEKRTAATEAAAAPSAVQLARARYLCKSLPQLFDAVQTQFVLTGKQAMELILLVAKLNKAYRDRGMPTTDKVLLEDLNALAAHAAEWCSIYKGAASGKRFFRVKHLQQHRIAAIRLGLTRIEGGSA